MYERNALECHNRTDVNRNPLGGEVYGTGIDIKWQDGPLGNPPAEPNGAFVEDVIEAARQRIEFYQGCPFACRENAIAITKLEEALHWLEHRRLDRMKRGVQGLNEK